MSFETDLSFKFSIDDAELEKLVEHMEVVNKHFLHDIGERIAGLARDTWRLAASGLVLPGMTRMVDNEQYRNSIKIESVHTRNQGSSHMIAVELVSDYERAEDIEKGHPAVDLKPGLLSGPAAKTSKDGKMYTTVPFKHPTATVPPAFATRARQGSPIRSKMGQRTKLAIFVDPSRRIMLENYTWKTGTFSELVQVHHLLGHVASAEFMTFRTVSENSDPDSWILPAVPPNPIREAVIRHIEPEFEHILLESLKVE